MTMNTMLRDDMGTSVSSREIETTSSRLVYIPMAVLYGQMFIIRLEYEKNKKKQKKGQEWLLGLGLCLRVRYP